MFFNDRDSFWGIDCIYVETQNGLKLYPINLNDIGKLLQHTFNLDYNIRYKNFFNYYTDMSVHNIQHIYLREFELCANYKIVRYDNTPVSMMEITGEAIDSLFNAMDYYYYHRNDNKEAKVNLLYDQDIVDKWKINNQEKEIIISLYYGEVLNSGNRSDAKIHPKLLISFSETNNANEIYEIYSIVKFFLQVVRYGFNIGNTQVYLFANKGTKKCKLGELIDFSIKDHDCAFSLVKYAHIRKHINSLLQFAADNHTMQIDFFPNEFRSIRNDPYNGMLFASIFAGFERECHNDKDMYEKVDDSHIRQKKQEIIDLIHRHKDEDEDNKWFYSGIEERINQFGTQMGQERRIINAYQVLSNALCRFMNHVFFTPLTGFDNPAPDIKEIAKSLSRYRGKVIHDGEKTTFSIDEIPYVHFLEILVYSMILKRASLPDKEIETLVGVVFGFDLGTKE